MIFGDDVDAWSNCNDEDLWIFDKLLLSRKLKYNCGPVGVNVPTPGKYVIRPITNLMGMGIDSSIIHLNKSTDHLPTGHFWCQCFEGRHLSVDYIDNEQVLCVEGFRTNESPLYKWDRWERVNDDVPPPEILRTLKEKYEHINCEFIGNKLIEVHFRLNYDFLRNVDANILHVVWKGESTIPPQGMVFVSDPEYKRLGFFKQKNE